MRPAANFKSFQLIFGAPMHAMLDVPPPCDALFLRCCPPSARSLYLTLQARRKSLRAIPLGPPFPSSSLVEASVVQSECRYKRCALPGENPCLGRANAADP